MKRISIINDEISDDPKRVVLFLKLHKIKNVDLRSINGKNVLDIPLPVLRKLAIYLNRNGIKVTCIASPILKWYPSGIKAKKVGNIKIDSFGFNNKSKADYEKVFIIADIFKTKYIRVFSFLKYKDFKIKHLDKEIEKLLDLAKKKNKILLLENEPACNIDSVDSLYKAVKRYNSKHLRVLLDIGNLYKQGKKLQDKDIVKLGKYIRYVHIKDYSQTKKEYVPVGAGDINYKKHLSSIKKFADKDLIFSIETHTNKKNRYRDSGNSINELKEILSNKKIRYGIVGCGRILKKHLLAIKADKNSELGGVFDIDKKKMNSVGEEHFRNLGELIENVDVVDICTPHHTHKDMIIKALRSNKKCLCEKPVCLNEKEANEIRKIKNYDKNIFVVFQNRFNPPILFLKKLINSKKTGKILYIFGNVRWFRDKDYYKKSWRGKKKLEGGILFNQGIHIIDIMMENFSPKSTVKVINSFRKKIYHKKINTEDLFLAQFKSGDTIFNLEVVVSSVPRNLESSIFVIFERGSIKIGGVALNELLYSSFKDKCDVDFKPEVKNSPVYGNGHNILIKKLSEYLLTGKKDINLVSFEEAYKRTVFINQLYKTAKEIKYKNI
ncbi:MAG TPA: hypothetical protein ENI19_02355 [Candidatus Nealsonbacteria bacterium]|uniref:Gfo/Idh/MocA-like oxidoreductase N-terminal domain-containing protein n=1 Tax=marine sediment metagenome TaxID=412755 RepID=A0A0F9XTN8_9ZZZZ|nr:hypothetical protein [Candidatus Nealsonbacteria bacterium]HEB46529.1 hypothetical protein [Candidatus Nealsonbacteria bacterium]